jgi:2-hydroxyglutaryl-CoA dehydratase, D-component.
MLVGSANDDVGLVRVMEGEKAVVVADNLCFGSRFYTDKVEENGDPVSALSKRYLGITTAPGCTETTKGDSTYLYRK